MGDIIEVRSFRNGAKYRYLIKNLASLEINLITPASNTPIPTAADNSNVLTKAEGNTMRFTVSWVIHDEPSDTVMLNTYNTAGTDVGVAGSTLKGFGGTPLTALRLADNQVKFLTQPDSPTDSGFQPTQIEEVYQIIIGQTTISRVGMIESLSITKQGSSPVIWQGNITFISGANPLG